MLQVGSKIKLSGLSQKGKNRIRELDSDWQILRIAERIQCSSESGPWLLIQSAQSPAHHRWIHRHHDGDFWLEGAVCV